MLPTALLNAHTGRHCQGLGAPSGSRVDARSPVGLKSLQFKSSVDSFDARRDFGDPLSCVHTHATYSVMRRGTALVNKMLVTNNRQPTLVQSRLPS